MVQDGQQDEADRQPRRANGHNDNGCPGERDDREERVLRARLEPGERALKASRQVAKQRPESHRSHKSRGAETGKPQVAWQGCWRAQRCPGGPASSRTVGQRPEIKLEKRFPASPGAANPAALPCFWAGGVAGKVGFFLLDATPARCLCSGGGGRMICSFGTACLAAGSFPCSLCSVHRARWRG